MRLDWLSEACLHAVHVLVAQPYRLSANRLQSCRCDGPWRSHPERLSSHFTSDSVTQIVADFSLIDGFCDRIIFLPAHTTPHHTTTRQYTTPHHDIPTNYRSPNFSISSPPPHKPSQSYSNLIPLNLQFSSCGAAGKTWSGWSRLPGMSLGKDVGISIHRCWGNPTPSLQPPSISARQRRRSTSPSTRAAAT